VHAGTLRGSGLRVALKVQHEGLRETAAADIHTVAALVAIVKALPPRFDYAWLAAEIRDNLPPSWTSGVEADNAVAAAAAFAHRGGARWWCPPCCGSIPPRGCSP
jgi:aarF domain-containing kinase